MGGAMIKGASRNDVPEVFSEVTRALLTKSGWWPNYHGPVDLYVAVYRDEELKFPRAARRFLDRFGGLVIQYKTKMQQDDVLEFRADRAARGSGQDTLVGYEEMAGEHPLCPIGSYSFGMCMLLMDAKARVFGGTEWSLLLVGRTGEEAIERILTGVPAVTMAATFVKEGSQSRRGNKKRRE
jgi:hypothetical protein